MTYFCKTHKEYFYSYEDMAQHYDGNIIENANDDEFLYCNIVSEDIGAE